MVLTNLSPNYGRSSMPHDLYEHRIAWSFCNWRVLVGLTYRHEETATQLRDDDVSLRLLFEQNTIRRFGRRDEVSIRRTCGKDSNQEFVSQCTQ